MVPDFEKFTDTLNEALWRLQITDFDAEELCPHVHGAPPLPYFGNALTILTVCQQIRDHFGAVTLINSGYRPPKYNRRVGGAENSEHLLCSAADVDVLGVSPAEVARFIDDHPFLRRRCAVGRYETFTHVDIRHWADPTDHPARWSA